MLDSVEIPSCLVLNRWSQFAKESISGNYLDGSHYWDSHLVARHATLVNLSKEVADLSYKDIDDYKRFLEYLTDELAKLKGKYSNEDVPDSRQVPAVLGNILNPPCSRRQGSGPSVNNIAGRCRRAQTCGICGATGHSRRACPTLDVDGDPGPRGSIQSTSVRLSSDG